MEGSFGSLSVRGAPVTGATLIVLGLAAGLSGWLLLRRSGSSWRVGRLLAAAPRKTLAEAAELAAAGEQSYVRLHGRIDSDEEFGDEDGKPIVFRRRRLQQRRGRGGWQTFDDERQAVPFRVVEAGAQVAIDIEALGDGLVVVPRESEGIASDLTEDSLTGPLPELAPETPVRLRIEQVSSVDHATVGGVPRIVPGGAVVLGPGLGRPLVLTTLELDEAMRVLAGDRRKGLLAATGLLVAAPVLLVGGAILLLLGP